MPSENRLHEPRAEGSCLRQCPTPPGDARALITHNIAVSTCLARQREFYHKCHRCLYRGRPAGFVVERLEVEEVPSRANGVAAPARAPVEAEVGA